MSNPWVSPFPHDVAVVCRDADGLPVLRCAGADTPSLILYGPEVDPREVDAMAGPTVPCLPVAAVLGLLAPEGAALPAAPAALLDAYLEAAGKQQPRAGMLRLALEALPASAVAERRLLARALATAATTAMQRRTVALAPGAAPGAALLDPQALATTAPHALLERCYAAVAAWRQGHTGAFEARPGQLEMSHAVLEALLGGGTLVVEAGTGTGKSLAYALPALLFALLSGRRVVVSTHTRALQEQLLQRELPLLWSCFALGSVQRPEGRRGLRWAKLLGRSNYVCHQALERWVVRCSEQGGSIEAARLVLAVLQSGDGSLDELVPGAPAAIRSRRETCGGRACRSEPACPVYAAREAARAADVLVVNHALLCADGQLDGTLLGDYAAVVVDEAHALEKVAREALALRLGTPQVEALAGLTHRVEAESAGVALLAPALWARLPPLVAASTALRTALQQLLGELDLLLPRAARRRTRQRYRDPDEVFGGAREASEALQTRLATAMDALVPFLAAGRDSAGTVPEVAGVLEVATLLGELQREIAAAFACVRQAREDDWVYHLDFSAPGKGLLQIVATPLEVGPSLQSLLAQPERAVVYTSATLCVQGDAGFVRRGLGVSAAVPSLFLPSPFHFERQCTVVSTAALGDYREPQFVGALAGVVEELHRRTARRLLVLLTSHAMLRDLHAHLTARLGAAAPLLSQGITAGREVLAARFATLPGAILLGTNSFWEGVDFPGQALEIVVLAKLPFAVPNEPFVEARCERLRAHGEDAFASFVLPEALLRFRQGFGRLIRSDRDRGAVLLLDGRLSTREYGEQFIAALPAHAEEFDSAAALVAHVESWFAGC